MKSSLPQLLGIGLGVVSLSHWNALFVHLIPSRSVISSKEGFLKEVDSTMTKIASEIEPRLKDVLVGRFWAEHEFHFASFLEEIALGCNHLQSGDLKMLQM